MKTYISGFNTRNISLKTKSKSSKQSQDYKNLNLVSIEYHVEINKIPSLGSIKTKMPNHRSLFYVSLKHLIIDLKIKSTEEAEIESIH